MKSVEEVLNQQKYAPFGGYAKFKQMLDDGVPYRIIARNFGDIDVATVYRWVKRSRQIDSLSGKQ